MKKLKLSEEKLTKVKKMNIDYLELANNITYEINNGSEEKAKKLLKDFELEIRKGTK